MKKKYTIEDIKKILGKDIIEILGNDAQKFMHAKPIQVADADSISFYGKKVKNAATVISSSKASSIICSVEIKSHLYDINNKMLILVKNPRLSFLRLVNNLFKEPLPWGIHSTASVHPDAKVHKNTYIGPFTFIDKNVVIKEGTIIKGHVHIHSNVAIGKKVIIHAGAVIGSDGFGYERNELQELEFFPSLGGVIIDDYVEIHSNTNVDRGTLGDTIIGTGTKIDKFCHIGHNSSIGKWCVITAKCMIGGSAKIEDYVWIAPCVCIRDGGILIESHSFIGMMSNITKNVKANSIVMGNPAMNKEDFIRIHNFLVRIADRKNS
jgi:UDP-3-O-[3-hydroxymyristoyl] glucosamine N-acyltransferase